MEENQIKSVVFLSNYFNHHQQPFSDKMYNILGKNYLFVQTEPMETERKNMGWAIEKYPEYVVTEQDIKGNINIYQNIIDNADAVIIGSAPESLIENRKNLNKLIFRYSERPLKKSFELLKYPIRYYKWHKVNPKNKPIYMLCASAYTASDYAKFGLFKDKCYKWGYFPETKKYENIISLIKNKEKNSIVWVARFINWKHPEIALNIAKRLKNEGYNFCIKMIGNGKMLEEITQAVTNENLTDCIKVLGAMKPEEVRKHMEKSEIHLFTSDRQEGWGAVLNESMNSACVPVANRQIGSVPFLINNNENGFMYNTIDDLYQKVKLLLDIPEKRIKMAKNAYKTITEEWNAETAAQRFMNLASNISYCRYESGPLSKSKIIMDN